MLRGQLEDYLVVVAPRYAASSLSIFRSGLRRFEVFAEAHEVKAAADITEEVAGDFQVWLQHHKLSESTVYMAMRSLVRFVAWAFASELTLWDGSYELAHPKSKIPKPPTAAVMKRILSLPKRATPEGFRDFFALELLYVLGLRRAELCALNLRHLDLVKEKLLVRGKGGDERLLPVSPKLKITAQRYLFNVRPALLPAATETALFLGDEGRRLTLEALYYIVKKYGELLDLKLSTHQLRHACATHLVESGMELAQVQQLLGHRRLSSSKRYAQVDAWAMEREFHRVHPRARRD